MSDCQVQHGRSEKEVFSYAALSLSVILSFGIIPYAGFLGAGIALTGGFCFLFIISFISSQKVYHISYEYKRIAILFISSILFFIVGHFLPFQTMSIRVLLKMTLVVLFPCFLFAIGFFHREEKARAKKICVSILKKVRLYR